MTYKTISVCVIKCSQVIDYLKLGIDWTQCKHTGVIHWARREGSQNCRWAHEDTIYVNKLNKRFGESLLHHQRHLCQNRAKHAKLLSGAVIIRDTHPAGTCVLCPTSYQLCFSLSVLIFSSIPPSIHFHPFSSLPSLVFLSFRPQCLLPSCCRSFFFLTVISPSTLRCLFTPFKSRFRVFLSYIFVLRYFWNLSLFSCLIST